MKLIFSGRVGNIQLKISHTHKMTNARVECNGDGDKPRRPIFLCRYFIHAKCIRLHAHLWKRISQSPPLHSVHVTGDANWFWTAQVMTVKKKSGYKTKLFVFGYNCYFSESVCGERVRCLQSVLNISLLCAHTWPSNLVFSSSFIIFFFFLFDARALLLLALLFLADRQCAYFILVHVRHSNRQSYKFRCYLYSFSFFFSQPSSSFSWSFLSFERAHRCVYAL